MNLSELRTEVKARGFNYLDDDRIDTYIKLAYTEVTEQELWPFLLTTAVGSAPFYISDLRAVESVEDPNREIKLEHLDRRQLGDWYPASTVTGDPQYWYFGAARQIDVWPLASSTSLTVRYYRVPLNLSADEDTPIVPNRYHYALVDYAVARAAADNQMPDLALSARLEGDRTVEFMVNSLIGSQVDGPAFYVVGIGDDQ